MAVGDELQGRAVRRAGELLEEFQSKGGRPPKTTEGAHGSSENGGPKSQKEAARQAGLSPHQERQARNVAKVPEGEFEEAVESDDPPSVTELADRLLREGYAERY